ncbi:hypothetical protein G7Y89_g8756 [Cudoniella acicularis]|uniref:Glutathione S-transferase n=1 Tax=Cudoniella acicularis TaxID=354080 RepID=A0A8H4RIA1_9HELO|nr:hypothetical protein G7Y89_g8756 [Cudoniella acicularis]
MLSASAGEALIFRCRGTVTFLTGHLKAIDPAKKRGRPRKNSIAEQSSATTSKKIKTSKAADIHPLVAQPPRPENKLPFKKGIVINLTSDNEDDRVLAPKPLNSTLWKAQLNHFEPRTPATITKPRNSQSQRILWLLEELDIEYNLVLHERNPSSHPTAPFLSPETLKSTGPYGKAPLLITGPKDGTRYLPESSAIATYLIRTFDTSDLFGLQNGDWIRDEVICSLVSTNLNRTLFFSLYLDFGAIKPGDGPGAARLKSLGSVLGDLERELKEGPKGGYFMGERPGRADILAEFQVSMVKQRGWADLKGEFPLLDAWLERVYGREAWKRALEKGNGYDLNVFPKIPERRRVDLISLVEEGKSQGHREGESKMKTATLFAAVFLAATTSAVALDRRYIDYSKVEPAEDKLKPRYIDYSKVETSDNEKRYIDYSKVDTTDDKLKARYIDYSKVDTAEEKLKPRYIDYSKVEAADNEKRYIEYSKVESADVDGVRARYIDYSKVEETDSNGDSARPSEALAIS